MATIRHATPDDARAITRIWNHVIRETIITFDSTEKTEGEVAELIAARPDAFFAVAAPEVVGFGTFAPFRRGVGYARTMEHTILIEAVAHGLGVGRRMMTTLSAAAAAAGAHSLIAAISGENTSAIAFHARMGFEIAGRLPEVGWKFGRWHDLVLMRKRL